MWWAPEGRDARQQRKRGELLEDLGAGQTEDHREQSPGKAVPSGQRKAMGPVSCMRPRPMRVQLSEVGLIPGGTAGAASCCSRSRGAGPSPFVAAGVQRVQDANIPSSKDLLPALWSTVTPKDPRERPPWACNSGPWVAHF
ncbi:hypothetical protein K461DRAFT_135459 [Myriangium duriaei CBS 260.36]|uniref:Uncharacterized protein n=1 Tax=Myriangium duriaei CBS 260.36 TaxID=1168546 RepID=A0A9P4MG37_9PEZI|nr:hypothetical protein K461DRAFT_135459 [Myriangium duriaei CBS 260.36]